MNSENYYVNEWENSYSRGDNNCFIASDEIVRFVSRYLVKRVGINKYKKLHKSSGKQKILDACCGIGRNLVFGEKMGLDMYGFDLSSIAIKNAREFCLSNFPDISSFDIDKKLKVSSINSIPWNNSFFDHIFCEMALDSMKYAVAKKGIIELARVVKNEGLFYCSLISGEKESVSSYQNREEIVKTIHEEGTIQSYFNEQKVYDLLEPEFTILNLELHKIISQNDIIKDARWHVVAKNKM